MNKAKNKFVMLTELTIILLLTFLLTVINVLNFTMAAEDADGLTERIAQRHGSYDMSGNNRAQNNAPIESGADAPEEMPSFKPSSKPESAPGSDTVPENSAVPDDGSAPKTTNTAAPTQTQGNSDPTKRPYKPFHLDNHWMSAGPNSAEMNYSLRYFTFAFDKDDNAQMIDYRMSAVSESEAEEWAESLLGSAQTGWTNVNYRYRVYQDDDRTFVTVIDQGRELWPCFRILFISIFGGMIFIVISLIISWYIGKRLFKPIEETDRKQKLFIAKLENEFKIPLTIINADTETLDRQNGANPQTQSINKQVKRMTRLVRDLGALTVFEEPEKNSDTNVSDLLTAMLENSRRKYEEKQLALSYDIAPDVFLNVTDEAMNNICRELISNSLKYSVSTVTFSLQRHRDRIKIVQSNDTTLPSGSCDQIFDRFTTLENASGTNSAGLGLAHVKDIVKNHDGRISAFVKNGVISIIIDL